MVRETPHFQLGDFRAPAARYPCPQGANRAPLSHHRSSPVLLARTVARRAHQSTASDGPVRPRRVGGSNAWISQLGRGYAVSATDSCCRLQQKRRLRKGSPAHLSLSNSGNHVATETCLSRGARRRITGPWTPGAKGGKVCRRMSS